MKGRLRPSNSQVAGSIPTGPTTLNSAFAVRRLAGRWPRPHRAHTFLRGRPCGGVHTVGQGAEVVVEEAGVDVRGHGRRPMPGPAGRFSRWPRLKPAAMLRRAGGCAG